MTSDASIRDEPSLADLAETARLIRKHIVQVTYRSRTGHVGTALSCADVVTALYFGVMRVDPANPAWPDRDRFIMSKGHGCAAWYAALAERGYFPVAELETFRTIGSRLQGHPDMSKTPGVEMTAGSLGHGLGAGLGMALGLRMDGRAARVFVLIGDGESQEGLIWESAMAAPRFRADNLVAIVDYNHFQSGAGVDETMPLEPLADKWRSFGWHVVEVDGHDLAALVSIFRSVPSVEGKPTAVIAHTTKGKGVSFMEGDNVWHGKPPSREETRRAMLELGFDEVIE